MKTPVQMLWDRVKHSSTIMGSDPEFKKYSVQTGHDVKTKKKLLSDYDQEDLDIQNHPMYKRSMQFLNDLYNPDSQYMKNFAAPYMRHFNEELIPNLTEQFAGADAMSSSGFNQSMGKASSDFASNLAFQKGQMQMQGLPYMQNAYQQPYANLLNRLQLGLGAKKYDYGNVPGQPGLIHYAAQGVGQGAGIAARGASGGMF